MIIHHQLTLLSPCMASRAGPAWDRNEGIADTDRKLGLGRVDSLVEKPQHPGSSLCLLYTVEERGGVFEESGIRRQGLWYVAGSRGQV